MLLTAQPIDLQSAAARNGLFDFVSRLEMAAIFRLPKLSLSRRVVSIRTRYRGTPVYLWFARCSSAPNFLRVSAAPAMNSAAVLVPRRAARHWVAGRCQGGLLVSCPAQAPCPATVWLLTQQANAAGFGCWEAEGLVRRCHSPAGLWGSASSLRCFPLAGNEGQPSIAVKWSGRPRCWWLESGLQRVLRGRLASYASIARRWRLARPIFARRILLVWFSRNTCYGMLYLYVTLSGVPLTVVPMLELPMVATKP